MMHWRKEMRFTYTDARDQNSQDLGLNYKQSRVSEKLDLFTLTIVLY